MPLGLRVAVRQRDCELVSVPRDAFEASAWGEAGRASTERRAGGEHPQRLQQIPLVRFNTVARIYCGMWRDLAKEFPSEAEVAMVGGDRLNSGGQFGRPNSTGTNGELSS